MNTFSEIVQEKVTPLYEMMQRVENLLVSVVSIRYPELKRKLGTPSTPSAAPPAAPTSTPSNEIATVPNDDDEGYQTTQQQ